MEAACPIAAQVIVTYMFSSFVKQKRENPRNECLSDAIMTTLSETHGARS